MVRALGRALPALCEVCGAWPDGPLCPQCRRDLAPLLPRCPGCARPVPVGVARCDGCTRDPPPWTAVLARVDYAYPWDAWIRALKSRGAPGLARTLAALWLDDPTLRTRLAEADLWTPIPLAPARLAERGYNQSWVLMRALARLTATPPGEPTLLARNPDAPILHHLDASARRQQVHHLIRVSPVAAARVRGRHVLVVDDVMTTGTTLRAATWALRAAGARAVSALVVARTPPPDSGVE